MDDDDAASLVPELPDEPDPDEPGYAVVEPSPVAGVPDDTWTLGEARKWLLDRVEHGEKCPLCTQFTKIYKRKVNSAMARALILMWKEGDLSRRLYVHVPSIDPTRGGDVAKLGFWGLIEEEKIARTDGGRAGYWRVTQKGEDWINGKTTIQKYARVYDGRLLSLTGAAVDINEALGDWFRLDDLMEGV